MKNDTKAWLKYADENIKAARMLLESSLFSISLQNTQQAIEKYLKALIIEKNLEFHKTHQIQQLVNILKQAGYQIDISNDDIELIDSIYLPTKYPMGSALPDFNPGHNICAKCLLIADIIKTYVENYLR